jgi:hypothetical protein
MSRALGVFANPLSTYYIRSDDRRARSLGALVPGADSLRAVPTPFAVLLNLIGNQAALIP